MVVRAQPLGEPDESQHDAQEYHGHNGEFEITAPETACGFVGDVFGGNFRNDGWRWTGRLCRSFQDFYRGGF